jgi:hypothetical protein
MGVFQNSSERLDPVRTSNGSMAVLVRRPAKIRRLTDDFVPSMGREGLSSILATLEAHTPTIDSLAHNGIMLDNYYIFKYSASSRAMLLGACQAMVSVRRTTVAAPKSASTSWQ